MEKQIVGDKMSNSELLIFDRNKTKLRLLCIYSPLWFFTLCCWIFSRYEITFSGFKPRMQSMKYIDIEVEPQRTKDSYFIATKPNCLLAKFDIWFVSQSNIRPYPRAIQTNIPSFWRLQIRCIYWFIVCVNAHANVLENISPTRLKSVEAPETHT